MPLTDIKVKNAKPADKVVTLSDGFGLYLLVHPDGSKYWQLGYRFESKQKTFSIGVYPTITLANVRERRDQARKLLATGIDPNAKKQTESKAVKEKQNPSRSFTLSRYQKTSLQVGITSLPLLYLQPTKTYGQLH